LTVKDKYAHLALLGIGGAALLYFLLKQASAASTSIVAAPTAAPVSVAGVAPIQLGNVTISTGSGKTTSTSCGSTQNVPGAPVTVQKVPNPVWNASNNNFDGYSVKDSDTPINLTYNQRVNPANFPSSAVSTVPVFGGTVPGGFSQPQTSHPAIAPEEAFNI